MNDLSSFLPLQIQTRIDACEFHGEYESRVVFKLKEKEIWSPCPKCSAEKQAAQEREAEERRQQEKQRAWLKKLGCAGIPERFYDRTLERYVAGNQGQQQALLFAKQYAENFDGEAGRSAIFCGKPGTGKTHLAVGIGLELMQQGNMVLFTTVQRMVRRVKDSWRNNSEETESAVIELLVRPDLLILDEIGVQFGTDFERNLMFDVLNERYEKRRASILLSNLTVNEVKAFLGERVYDRLREDGGRAIPFDWDSYRKNCA